MVENFWILIETAICIVKRWKPSMGYAFAPEFDHAQERLHTCHFYAIFVGLRFVVIQKFCYHGNLT